MTDVVDPEDLRHLSPEELAEFDRMIADDPVPWRPLVGPQMTAAESEADIVGFGGSAGGGKSDLAIGLAGTEHEHSIIFRQTGTELVAIQDRLRKVYGAAGTFNGRHEIWSIRRHDGVPITIELGAFPNVGDEAKYQGRPHDLIVFDEASNMREAAVRFSIGWLRSVTPGQRKRVLLTFNPPTTPEGRWIIAFFAPWLDSRHPNPATPGELRWFATVHGVDIEVPDARPFVFGPDGSSRVHDFDRKKYSAEDVIEPMSRTFIPSRVVNNPFLATTGYMRVLQGLPEPLRSQMLKGDFLAGLKDDAFQTIPTAWVEAAMAKWRRPDKLLPMDSIGADIAMGGDDEHVIMRRHGMWFDEPIAHKGTAVPDGATSGGLVVAAHRDSAVMHIDLFGVGAMTYGFLCGLRLQTIGVNMGELVPGITDRTGRLTFKNMRSLLWWRMREALDPVNNTGIALPPNRRLLADLTTPKWSLSGYQIKVQSRDEIVAELGRSPDYGTAAILALIDTPKLDAVVAITSKGRTAQGHDPYATM